MACINGKKLHTNQRTEIYCMVFKLRNYKIDQRRSRAYNERRQRFVRNQRTCLPFNYEKENCFHDGLHECQCAFWQRPNVFLRNTVEAVNA